MSRILVSGSNGFIGNHIYQRLAEEGCEVTRIPRELLYSPEELTVFVKKTNPSQIFHFAAYGNKYDQRKTDLIVKANILGTFNLLEATREIDYQAFINTGSSSEYGVKDKPMHEDDKLEPNSIYGATKAAATLIANFFASNYKKPVVTIRPFSVYGPGDDSHHFIPTIIRCFKEGKTLNLASGVHDWIFVDDFINGCVIIAKNARSLAGSVVNIGTGVQTTNHEVVKYLKEIMGVRGRVKEIEKIRSYDTIKSWVADNSKLKSLGWNPSVSLEEGLKKTFDEY